MQPYSRAHFAALLALAFFVVPAAAQVPKCQPLAAARTETAELAARLHGSVVELHDKQAAAYLAVVNAVPPVSTLEAEGILVFVLPDRGATIGLVEGENVCLAGRISIKVHDDAIKAALGRDT